MAQFLTPQGDWGFAVSLGAYDETSFDNMLATPLSLFRANGYMLTLSWVPIASLYKPVIELHGFEEIGGTPTNCSQTIFSGASGVISGEDLARGYRLYIMHESFGESGSLALFMSSSDGTTPSLYSVFNGSQGSTDGQCMNILTDDWIQFGKGGTAQTIVPMGNAVDVPDLQARVDNIVLFNPVGLQGFVDVPDKEAFLHDVDAAGGDAFLLPSNQSEDGWHWYPIDPNPEVRSQNVYNELWDETVHINDNYIFEMFGTGSQQPLDSNQASIFIIWAIKTGYPIDLVRSIYEVYIPFVGFDSHRMYFSKYYSRGGGYGVTIRDRLRWYYKPD